MTAPRPITQEPPYPFADFQRRARAGHEQELRVARLLRHWGYDVPDWDLVFRDEADTHLIDEYRRTQKDLIVAGRYLEVKSRTLRFTTRDSYPYPTVMLETVSGWQAKERKPDVYVLCSQPAGGILAVDARDMSRFTREKRVDRSRGLEDEWFFAPKELLRPHTWLEGFLAASN